jgi:hypothetical protein
MLEYFLSMLMLVCAIVSVIAGIFTIYFGSGKSKAVGAILPIVGIIVFILFLWGAGVLKIGSVPDLMDFAGVVINGIVAVVGAIVGALIALGIFLLTILKT